MSGCAHNGILSILDAYVEKYGKAPDLVVSGFHLMKKTDYKSEEIKEIEDSARELKNYPTQYVTCHCCQSFFRVKKRSDVVGKTILDRRLLSVLEFTYN